MNSRRVDSESKPCRRLVRVKNDVAAGDDLIGEAFDTTTLHFRTIFFEHA